MCSDGEHYIPNIPEDKFSTCSTSTDELSMIGTAFPIYFALIRRIGFYMLFLTCLMVFGICGQSYIFYNKLFEVQDEEMAEEVNELSDWAKFSAYSVQTFRLVYGFDYGQWAIDAYFAMIITVLLLTLA